jgi:predicted patatin/cPLA2 family phospholipase
MDIPGPNRVGMAPNVASPDNPVIREIQRRLTMIRRGQDLSDLETKLGLVVEGGGMRGVTSGGSLIAMEQLGLTFAFDEVYGESAGAINACYFLASQAAFGGRIYLEDLPSLRFFNPVRVNKVLDMDFLIDHVMTRVKPLAVDKVMESQSKLFVPITNVDEGTARVVDVKEEKPSLLRLLKATAAVIPLYNKSVMLDGIPYADGGITDPLPVIDAINHGCTHILVLLTRPYGFRLEEFDGAERMVLKVLLRRWNRKFVDAFFHIRYRRYNEARDIAFGDVPAARGVNLAVLCPTPGTPEVARTTISRRRLTAAMEHSIRETLQLLGPASKGVT